MATKINADFYGAENTFANVDSNGNIKHAASTLWDLLDAGKYTGGSLEQTAAPWGMGRSSASSLYCFAATNESGAYSRKDWYNDKGNTPMYMYYRSTIAQGDIDGNSDIAYFTTSALDGTQIKKGLQTARYNLTTAGASNRLDSTLSEDSGDNVNYAYCSTLYPVTYADYAKIRIYCGAVCYIPDGQQFIKYCTIEDIINNNVTVKNIVGFLMYFVNTDDRNNYHYVYPTGGGSELPVPEGHKTYYGDNGRVQPWRRIDTMGFFCPYNWYNTSDHYYPNFSADKMPPATAFDDITTFDPQFTTLTSLNMYNWGHISPKNQVFDDVSYHWEVGIVPFSVDYQDFEVLADGTTLMGTDYRIAGKLVIDDSTYNTTNEAVTAAIMHELAFIGFPVAKTYSDCNAAIGSSGILLPIFDEHWITTGNYVSGSDSLNLPNANWRDVFGSTMPDYDPNYDPEPEPDDGDSGDLDNSTLSGQYFRGSNRYYLVNESTLKDFIGAVNGMYVSSPDDTQLKLDFKGSNPNDYIVGIYGIPIDLVAATVGETIHLGPVDTTIPAAVLSPTWQHTINFGEYEIPAYFGDFRDFEPYTSIELYIPLCGTVQLDPREYVGHTVKVDGIFDLQTGELTCRVIRKSSLGDTVTHTVNGSIWVSIPVSARDMGDFQNNQHQIKMALIQTGFNQISRTFGRASTDINSTVSAVKTGGKSGLNLNGLNAVTVAGDAIQTGIDTANLTYQLTHTPAPISTTSTASTSNGVMMYNRAKIFIKRCDMLPTYNAETYAHTIGHACIINTTIGDETTEDSNSLIVCSNADLSGIPATAAEINAIQSLLTGGIYV